MPSAPQSPTGAGGAGTGATAGKETSSEPEKKVRGNVRANGDKVYHLPGDPNYDRVNAEQTFATREEAEAAGYRRAGH